MNADEMNRPGPAPGLAVRLVRHTLRAALVAAGAAVCAGASAVLLVPAVLGAGGGSVRRTNVR